MNHRYQRVSSYAVLAFAAYAGQLASAQDEIEGVRALKRTLNPGDLEYHLIGSTEKLATPKDGYKLLIVLPGGDGSAQFQPFIKNIYKQSLDKEYLVVQLVAPKWKTDMVTWPTAKDKMAGKKVSVEDFIRRAVEDVAKRTRIDKRHVYTLSWSSGGPAAYAASVTKDTPITGSFVAMSVFHADRMPNLKLDKGKPYYILHSPQDQVCSYFTAKIAEDVLRKAGANVEFVNYEGGHGWHGDIFGNISQGIEWLEKQAGQSEASAKKADAESK
jgi:predicted esterase